MGKEVNVENWGKRPDPRILHNIKNVKRIEANGEVEVGKKYPQANSFEKLENLVSIDNETTGKITYLESENFGYFADKLEEAEQKARMKKEGDLVADEEKQRKLVCNPFAAVGKRNNPYAISS